MDSVERLTLEAWASNSLEALEHVHRYLLARELCAGCRVLDLCCGSGFGSQILSDECPMVHGIDKDGPTIRLARTTFTNRANLSFDVGDAMNVLDRPLADTFDAIVMLEGLEHLSEPERALQALEHYAKTGLRLVISIPNSKTFEEENPFHVNDFGYDEALTMCARLDASTMLYQFLAEGSLIRAAESERRRVDLVNPEDGEVEYANHFLVCANCDPTQTSALAGRLQLAAAPIQMRYLHGLERANAELRRTNTRLGRDRLGVADSAAGTLLAKIDRLEMALTESQARIDGLERARAHDEWVEGLQSEIERLTEELHSMQATRAWRLVSRYWLVRQQLRGAVRRGVR